MSVPTVFKYDSITSRFIKLAALLLIYSFSTGICASADGIVSGQVIVRLNNETEIGDMEDDYETFSTDKIPGTNVFALKTPDDSDDLSFAIELQNDPRVREVEVDQELELPEIQGYPFHFPVDRTYNPYAYNNQNAYKQVDAFSSLGSKSITAYQTASLIPDGAIVAILDTGAAYSHPAISANLLEGWNAFDSSAPPDDIPDTSLSCYAGHGTMIAAIITRIAPNTRILPIRILNADGEGTIMNALKGLKMAINQGARIINMSFGTAVYSNILREALNEANDAGVLIVAAAGNSGKNLLSYPAAYDSVLCVASIGTKGAKSSFSNYGPKVSVAAPGENICSAYWDGGYATWSGTSFAAPFVSAQAALILNTYPTLDSETVEERIRATAHSLNRYNPLYRGMLGGGLIDIAASLQKNYDD